MPTVYVADYADELQKLGDEKFLKARPHGVLIVKGLAGTLQDSRSSGTVVSKAADIVQLGTLVGRVFPLVKGKFSPPGPHINVGRTADNDVAIPEYSISKHHCTIAVIGNEVKIIDAGSTNGTLLNGAPLVPKKPHPLAEGDTITMGRFALLFYLPRGFVAYLKESR